MLKVKLSLKILQDIQLKVLSKHSLVKCRSEFRHNLEKGRDAASLNFNSNLIEAMQSHQT